MTAVATQALSRLVLFDPQKRRLHLHVGQQAMWDSRAQNIVVVAGFQSGKTESGAHWLLREMQNVGPGDGYAVTSTYPLFEVKFQPAIHEVFHRYAGWQWEAGKQQYVSPNARSRLILRSAQSPGGLEAGTAICAWLDECGQAEFPQEAHEAIQRRVAVRRGRILYTTMAYNFGWFYQGPYLRALGGESDHELIRYASTENPNFGWDQYEKYKREHPDWKFRMAILAEFTRPTGLIYGDYEDAYAPQQGSPGAWGPVDLSQWREGEHGHLCRAFQIPVTWQRLVGVDFGGTEHTALVWLAEEPRSVDGSGGNYYVYRDALGGGLSGAEHARAALEYAEPVRMWLGGAKSEGEDRLIWQQCGVRVGAPYVDDVEPGIDRVVSLFRQRRLFLFDTETGLRSELGTYSRELDGSGEPLMRIDHKERFHRLDALRYIASAIEIDRAEAPKSKTDPRPRYVKDIEKQMSRMQHGYGDGAPMVRPSEWRR